MELLRYDAAAVTTGDRQIWSLYDPDDFTSPAHDQRALAVDIDGVAF
jgi:hypothetical protein